MLQRDWERKRPRGWDGFANLAFGRKAAEWALDGGTICRVYPLVDLLNAQPLLSGPVRVSSLIQLPAQL